jgi:hypothetical protein
VRAAPNAVGRLLVVESGMAAFGGAAAESRRSPVRSPGGGLAPIADVLVVLAGTRKRTLVPLPG